MDHLTTSTTPPTPPSPPDDGSPASAPSTGARGDSAIETLPLVPLRENVVFPHQMAPLGAGRPRSVGALEAAVAADGRVVLAVQRDPSVDDVGYVDLHPIAVVATVGAFRRLPNGVAQALVEGQRRVRLHSLETHPDRWTAVVSTIEERIEPGTEVAALVGTVKQLFADYVAAGAQVPPEAAVAVARATEPSLVADLCSAAPDLGVDDRVRLLGEVDVVARLRLLVPLLARQVEVAQLRSKIQEDVQKTINRSQREAILREQLKAIRRELAEIEGSAEAEDEDLATRVEKAGMPEAVKQRALKEVARLEQIPSASPEVGMVRTYIDWLLELPWGNPPPEHLDIERAERILDEDHYGLEKVKDRILEWLAVRQRVRQKLAAGSSNDEPTPPAEAAVAAAGGAGGTAPSAPRDEAGSGTSPAPGDEAAQDDGSTVVAGEAGEAAPQGPEASGGEAAGDAPGAGAPGATGTAGDDEPPIRRRTLQTPILCFVGPPGVGKTSLGRSIARALGRRFVRLSLGGIRDEAEIRGHRRTYIGALPGRIIQSMRQAGTRNPVIMLDEIDKVGMDFRGDPSAALLEVLDPEQNFEFSDHYLEVPYDLSHVLFITTANVAETISPPLRDRMEIIHISGYTEQEKLGIAERHLVPKQLEQHGLDPGELVIERDALLAMIRGYTREAGVRQLDRCIAQIARKVPRKLATGEVSGTVRVTAADLVEYLGPQRFDYGEAETEDQVGAATGVVVSEVGGDIVTVEALAIEGRSGELILTGQLGTVMEESARAALSWARVHGERYGAPRGFFDTHGIHVHVPAGAIPKDGPSAGVTMVTAMISAASGRPVRRDVAMTGEITLRGRVLPIGGVRDKLLAAHRAGIATFILPRRNLRDLHEVDKEILERLEVVGVDTVDEVLERALLPAGTAGRRPRRVGFDVPLPAAPPAVIA